MAETNKRMMSVVNGAGGDVDRRSLSAGLVSNHAPVIVRSFTESAYKRFLAKHPFVIIERGNRRRFASAKCAAHTAYHSSKVFEFEPTSQVYTFAEVTQLAMPTFRGTGSKDEDGKVTEQ